MAFVRQPKFKRTRVRDAIQSRFHVYVPQATILLHRQFRVSLYLSHIHYPPLIEQSIITALEHVIIILRDSGLNNRIQVARYIRKE